MNWYLWETKEVPRLCFGALQQPLVLIYSEDDCHPEVDINSHSWKHKYLYKFFFRELEKQKSEKKIELYKQILSVWCNTKYLIYWVIWIWHNRGAGWERAKWIVLILKQRKINQREVELPIPRLPCDLSGALLRPFPPKISSSFKQCSEYPPTPWEKAHCRGMDAALLEQIPICKWSMWHFPRVRSGKLQEFKAIPQLKQWSLALVKCHHRWTTSASSLMCVVPIAFECCTRESRNAQDKSVYSVRGWMTR